MSTTAVNYHLSSDKNNIQRA